MNKISIRVLIVGLLIFCFKSFAQTPVEIHQGGSVVSTSNPFYVTFSGDIEIDTTILQDILEQLEKNTYTGDYLNVRFNNTTIGATQSGTWNIGSITTLPSVTIGSMPAVTASNLDIRSLTSASDSVKVEGGNTSDVKVTLDSESVAVTGTFWQETQPVSGSVSVSNFPETQPVSGTVGVSGSVAVTGTFYQGTQPVSIASMPTTPVTGTFFQETQPVSIASMPSTPVTGTFWQETQPVSGTVTANAGTGTMAVSIASMPSTPVTGTFWQATQPVSGSVTVSGTVGTSTTLVRKESSQDLSAGALNYTTNFAAKTKVLQVLFHASTTISETVNISFNSTTSANYDTVVKSVTLSSESNVAWLPDNFVLLSGDEVTITCTNGGGSGTVYVTVVGETLN